MLDLTMSVPLSWVIDRVRGARKYRLMLAPRLDLPLVGPPVGPPAAPPVEPPVGCADDDCSRPTRINPSGRLLLAVGPSSGDDPIGGIPPPPIQPPPMPPRPPPWPRCDPGARWGEVALGSG